MQNTQPIATLVHLGAGRCRELEAHLALHPERLLLVEADPDLASALQSRTANIPQVEVVCAALSGHPRPVTFYRYNLPDVSSLRPATGLLQLFPGLKTVEQLRLNSVDPATVLQPLQLSAEQDNLLIIDLPGEEQPVLEALHQAQHLHLFRQIRLYCGRQSLYEGSHRAEEILGWLTECGFDLVTEDDGQDPDRPCWVLQHNTLQLRNRELREENEALRSRLQQVIKACEEEAARANAHQRQLAAADQTCTELRERLEQLCREKEEAVMLAKERQQQIALLAQAHDEQVKLAGEQKTKVAQITKEKEGIAKQLVGRQEQVELLTKARDEQASLAATYEQQVRHLTQERDAKDNFAKEQLQRSEQLVRALEEQTKLAMERQALLDTLTVESAQKVAEVAELLKLQKTQFDHMEKGLRSHISKGLNNSIRQIESFIGIETYLSRGKLLPALHGWPVSADFAYYLVGLVENNSYDLIIEFGSGASTVLMASAIYNQLERQAIRQLSENASEERRITGRVAGNIVTTVVRERVLPKLVDLPPRIVSFEHNRHYFDETRHSLIQAGILELVDLNYSPLRDYVTPEGERFLYYACEEKIAALATLLSGRQARVLVLVDGPPGATGRHARYPALPILLQQLSTHKIDVILDDCNRQEEKEILERWIELLDRRSFQYQKAVLAFEKGACLISI